MKSTMQDIDRNHPAAGFVGAPVDTHGNGPATQNSGTRCFANQPH